MATTETRNARDHAGSTQETHEYGIDRRVLFVLLSLPGLPIGVGLIGFVATRVLDSYMPQSTAPVVATSNEVEVAEPEATPETAEAELPVELHAVPVDEPIDVVHAVDVPDTDVVAVATVSTPVPAEVVPAEPIAPVEPDWQVREYELVAHMQRQATELDFNPHGQKVARDREKPSDQRLASLANRNLLAGLPLRGEDECSKDREHAGHADEVSKTLGSLRSRTTRRSSTMSLSESGDWFFEQNVLTELGRQRWNEAEKASTLDQILQVQSISLRENLVATLAKTPGAEAAEALAGRAVFDTAEQVRELATRALRERKVDHYRDRLIAGLRHPWAPAAVNAARVVVELRNDELNDAVRALLEQPDPSAPFEEDGHLVTRELVRVNHMRNCILCHAPSSSGSDLVRGFVPTPDRPLPVVYYQSRSRGLFVRADVTYLKQDFSQVHHVEKASPWPDRQRFDYFVRVRPLTKKEREVRSANSDTDVPTPQRRAMQLALLASEGDGQATIARKQLRKLLYESTREPAELESTEDESVNESES